MRLTDLNQNSLALGLTPGAAAMPDNPRELNKPLQKAIVGEEPPVDGDISKVAKNLDAEANLILQAPMNSPFRRTDDARTPPNLANL